MTPWAWACGVLGATRRASREQTLPSLRSWGCEPGVVRGALRVALRTSSAESALCGLRGVAGRPSGRAGEPAAAGSGHSYPGRPPGLCTASSSRLPVPPAALLFGVNALGWQTGCRSPRPVQTRDSITDWPVFRVSGNSECFYCEDEVIVAA